MGYRERKSCILNALELQPVLSFPELCKILDVSPTTIRRDISSMEKEGALLRFHGGVRKIGDISTQEASMRKKESTHVEAKKRIGQKAASLIHSNELIFIASGSTTYYMIDYMKDTSITVITNGIPHAEALNAKHIRTFLLCGFIKEKTRSVAGEETVRLLNSYQFDQVFIGANGISSSWDYLSADKMEYDIKKASMMVGHNAYVLVDSSKFNKTAMYHLSFRDYPNSYLITEAYDGTMIDPSRMIIAK